ncbi:MAG: hypothetical protein J5666_05575 [Bacilli bacterium]|nr:hypothetical protein [Bacilli bacterium]
MAKKELIKTRLTISYPSKGKIEVKDTLTNKTNVLITKEKDWKKTTKGVAFDKNTYLIEVTPWRRIKKKGHLVPIIETRRTRNRTIHINHKKIGVLKEKEQLARALFTQLVPIHHKLKRWETYYYDKTTKEVKVYHAKTLYALASYHKGVYEISIMDEKYLALCVGLILAAIDSVDSILDHFKK